MKKEEKFINPHLNRVKELQKHKKGSPKYNGYIDDTPEGTADLEDLDDWVKTIAEKD